MQKGIGQRLAILTATGLGLGYAPVASGTFGALLGLPLAAVLVGLPWWGQAAAVAVLAVAAMPVCTVAERVFGKKDDGRIVVDEYVTVPLCLLGLPWTTQPLWLAAAFVTHRVLDIIKPFPARRSQGIPHGPGIVIDDVISSLYALGLLHAARWALARFGA